MSRFEAPPESAAPSPRHCQATSAILALCFACRGAGGGPAPPPTPPAETWKLAGFAVESGPGGTQGLASVGFVIMPELVQLPTGTIRLYFGGFRTGGAGMDIWLAESTDGAQWQVRGVALAGSSDPVDPECEVTGASVVQLPDGRWRMYYQATPSTANGVTPEFQTMSAISTDGGVTFTHEAIPFTNSFFDPSSPLKEAGHARVLKVGGGYLAYVSARIAKEGNVLYAYQSTDGLSFSPPTTVLPGGHDPYVVDVAGTYYLYADTGSTPSGVSPAEVLMASSDAIDWSDPSSASFVDASGAPLAVGGPSGVADVAGLVMPNGKLRLFVGYFPGIAYFDRVGP